MKRNISHYLILLLIAAFLPFSIFGCKDWKGYRTQKEGGKDRVRKLFFFEDGIKAEDETGSPFSNTTAITGNAEIREITSCKSTGECEYKGYARFAGFPKPLDFNPLWAANFESQKVATADYGSEIYITPAITGAEGAKYTTTYMEGVKTEAGGGFSVPRRNDAFKKGIFIYDSGKSFAKLGYDPKTTNQRIMFVKKEDTVASNKFKMPVPIFTGDSFLSDKLVTMTHDQPLTIKWNAGLDPKKPVRGSCECNVKKQRTEVEFGVYDDGETVFPPKDGDKDGIVNFFPECSGECVFCRGADQTDESGNNFKAKECGYLTFTKVIPKK